ncbi:MAG: Cof-type HAD-IIB family hydrolase [Faecalibacterium sp.]
MSKHDIRVLALDLDGTLTNSEKKITPRTMAALKAAMAQGVAIVLASGRPTVGIEPVAKQLDLYRHGGYILSYNGGTIVDCKTGDILHQNEFPAPMIGTLCAFAKAQDVAVLSYNDDGVICERPQDEWALKECEINKIPMIGVENLASYIDYPISKMLLTLAPARMDAVEAALATQCKGQIDVYRSCAFFIEAVPCGVAKDASLAVLLAKLGFTRAQLMACGDGMNDRSMIAFAGVGVAMQNAEDAVKAVADYVTPADNDHDGVAQAIEQFILGF